MSSSKIRIWAIQAVCALLMVMTFVGTTTAAAATVRHAHTHHVHRAHHARHHHLGIPQHNGGDRDSDNNGAPSDGDGNQ